ncbi:MAG TPA: DUF2332 domain-containing protein [Acidimicrobiia bacterium]|nr:DUF2332 domain-containing protein [Acidimicrobiia bacterium]
MLNREQPDGGRIAERLRDFADRVGSESPLYRVLATALSEDPLAIDILGGAPHGQPPANLILAAVQYLLLEGKGPGLAAHYPSLHEGAGPVGDPVALFHEFLEGHREAVSALVASRRVQTNEVRRCTTLLPAFTTARDPEAPLALVEVGASIGLNLLFDRYRYDYGTAMAGPSGSPLTLTCEIREGDPPIPVRMPAVASRVGIDLHPIDVTDPAAVRWARALVWPEQAERVERLETAVALAREDPPTILAGDALDLLPGVIEATPDEASLVVYHSYVLNQWRPEDRARLDGVLAEASSARRIDRISIEMLARGEAFPFVDHTRYENGRSETRRLGSAHYHGEWLRWHDP